MVKENKTIENSLAAWVLVEPLITEATTALAEANKYVFQVSLDSNKKQIKQSIESLYKVKVTAINTITIPRKKAIPRDEDGMETRI